MNNKVLVGAGISLLLGLTLFESIAGNHAPNQVGARNRVWTQGVTGDPNSTVAIFDTGVDVNHQALGPYYGNDDWSGKTVFWHHASGAPASDDTTSFGPGHGSHAAGIIAGSGFGVVDGQGRVVNTNAYTSGLNGEYPEQTAMHVNKLGIIRIEYTFNSEKGNVNYLELRHGNKELTYDMSNGRKVVGGTTTVARLNSLTGTPELNKKDTEEELPEINWNVLEYEITSSAQFGTYHVVTNRSIPSSGMFSPKMHFVYVAHWPVEINSDGTDPQDGRLYYTGMAPDTKLFAVKATSASEFESTIGDLWSELAQYHTVIVNLSAGGSSLGDSGQIWNKLEGMGVIGVTAAGNDTGSSGLVAPANLDGTVAVGGITPAETIPWYVNSGPELDILAPGGSNMTGGGIISAHNGGGNFNMAGSAWGYDYITNDGMGMQGTSMATPSASGVFALVYDALGGWNNYVDKDDFALVGDILDKREKARHVKRLVFMTATELNTKREQTKLGFSNIENYYPILNRGYDPAQDAASQNYGKDNNEGYGRINADAAVDAVLHGLQPGDSASLNLVSSLATWTSTQIDAYGAYDGEYILEKAQQPKAFARHINVTQAEVSSVYGDGDANFVLNVPNGADFDLFVYQSVAGPNGQPLLLTRSINVGNGIDENITFKPTVAGQYYVVVKAVSGEGNATLVFNGEPCTDCTPDPVDPSSIFSIAINDLSINLTDLSADSDGYITNWSWDFGDSTTSSEQNPSHTYSTAANYHISLTVTDNDGLTSTSTQSITVSDSGGNPDPEPGENELLNGVATTGINVGDKASVVYYIDVLANSDSLDVVLTGNNGDADLYVRFNEEATKSNYDKKSSSFDSTENVSINNPQAGRWYVLVYGYNASDNLTLTATYAEGEPPTSGGPRFENTTDYTIGTAADIVVTSDIEVDRAGESGAVTVNVEIDHTYIGDLEINLITPDGLKHLLRSRSGGSSNDIYESYSVNFGSSESAGTWTLEVTDHVSRDGGKINSWSVQFQN
ncbi:hypothetical protein CJF42_20750 [Pseudoalteromonas sp. NBT06-2]|uniref:S8 family serine peptidase n=1 Tax=Pseudoalteromonas sp. NBT06-2 TaxID=2025950 RepID=UPI000BA61DD1|nr:S8 family serine peptidase [Pseudoalteromonas sp. NBT06-2]PAJ72524.1 hypothetical protein CJF42_20750 [Pseudoalteromonas sp. NBT06-2]